MKFHYKYFIFNKIEITLIYIHSKFIHSKLNLFTHSKFTHSLITPLMSQINITTPPSITQSRNQIGSITVNTAPALVTDTDYDDFEQDEYKDINAGVFFDGTLNNRENVEAGKEYDNMKDGKPYNADKAKQAKGWFGKRSGSYENEHSNISRSEPAYKEFKRGKLIQFRLYIEGIGTEDDAGDSKVGAGLGTGSTGIRAKVLKACEKVVDLIQEKGVEFIDTLTIDTFGFSRGAAASRNFIYELYKRKGQIKAVYSAGTQAPPTIIEYKTDYGALGEALKAKGIEIRSLVVRYTGLYDTVASSGVVHSNDTRELGLDAVRYSLHVLQLAADDEHRANFRLTNINSKGSLEKFLPGVHSDIGGGYTDKSDEDVRLNYTITNLNDLENDRDFLIEQGWYLPGEITISKLWGTLTGKRKGLSYTYSFIPLHIMTEYALDKQVEFRKSEITGPYPIPPELSNTKKRLDKYVAGNVGKMSFDDPTDRAMLEILRNRYFHFSAKYNSIGMGPNIENGVRKRVIQNG